MANVDSDSDYGYNFTASDEELLSAIVDSVSPPPKPKVQSSRHQRRSYQQGRKPAPAPTPTGAPVPPPAVSSAVNDALAYLSDDDLTFDIAELVPNVKPAHSHGPRTTENVVEAPAVRDCAREGKRKLSPAVPTQNHELASFITKTNPRSTPTMVTTTNADVRYPDLSQALDESAQVPEPVEVTKPEDTSNIAGVEDTRPPLLRFRTFPKKPFSVSDLTAGSWCELQYFFTLTQLPWGRRTKTKAMKAGSVVHERLEREIFTTVQVKVESKEDNFALKIWNVIQGLRSLRDTGLTRELEVWGFVEGNLVNGVIDGLSYDNPDPELEEDVISSRSSSQEQKEEQKITDFFPSSGTAPAAGLKREVFITDVKTRVSKTPPPRAQVRAALIQLFLYHRFLSEMASDCLDYIRVFHRYGLDPDAILSHLFMTQIGLLHGEIFPYDSQKPQPAFSEFSAQLNSVDTESAASEAAETWSELSSSPGFEPGPGFVTAKTSKPKPTTVKYRSLRELILLLKFELQLTFPQGASTLGQIVAVEYRYRGRRGKRHSDAANSENDAAEGSIISSNTFYVEPATLDLYLKETMQWWRGEREPRGVPLEEAFKCQSCEFAESCQWRDNLDQEALRKAQAKSAEKSVIRARTAYSAKHKW
ncbi:exonuclease V [Podospora didyma]|uniref:Exonuclease V n=1 Tax=Podospora didyma TaxID=330526 RepID=A0AAE0NXP5_9PEZI|nr:exonuclease V [Podospora didyma]